MSFIAAVGRTNVDLLYIDMPRIPNEGEEIYSADFDIQLGGGAPGTMVNVTRLGIPGRLATYLGEDMFSAFARNCFVENGVEPFNLHQKVEKQNSENRRGAQKKADIPVNVSSVLLTAGDRTFGTYCKPDEITDIEREAVYKMSTGARIVQMTPGYLDVYRRLKEEGAILIFDIGWEDGLCLERYEEYLQVADYFTPNIREALAITNTETPEDAIRVLARYFEKPMVKLDKDGCLILVDGQTKLIPSMPGVKAIDSTGAGDAFLAGFMYGLYHEYSFEEAVLFGNITGGTCVTGRGCLSAWVDEKELLRIAEELKSGLF